MNRAKVAGMSYIPLANEADSLLSAAQGKENFYGKERSPAQAALRVAGIKVEQYGTEQAKKQRGTDEYFKEKEKLDKEVATLPVRDREAYKRATGYAVSLVVWIMALSRVPVSIAYPMLSIGYVVSAVAAYFLFDGVVVHACAGAVVEVGGEVA